LIIANSEAGEKFHIERGFRPRQSKVIGNGIDTEKFRPDPQRRAIGRAELGIPPEAIVAIHVARVDPMKDHPTLLAALGALPQVQGLLVGAGTQTLSLPQNVRALGVRRDVDQLYPLADIVVSSSAFGEGFSNVVAEGMSAGLIPVATDVGAARAIVGEAGEVVAPGSIVALTAALAAAAGGSPQERQHRGLRARARVLENFSEKTMIDAYASLYAAERAASSGPTAARATAA
jgi:glycosyltransferase involved in cell wall biosynthesis